MNEKEMDDYLYERYGAIREFRLDGDDKKGNRHYGYVKGSHQMSFPAASDKEEIEARAQEIDLKEINNDK